MLKFILIFFLVFTATCGHAEKGLAARVNEQINYAEGKGLCYAPIVFDNYPKPGEVSIIRVTAKKRAWKLSNRSGSVINVEKKACKR